MTEKLAMARQWPVDDVLRQFDGETIIHIRRLPAQTIRIQLQSGACILIDNVQAIKITQQQEYEI